MSAPIIVNASVFLEPDTPIKAERHEGTNGGWTSICIGGSPGVTLFIYDVAAHAFLPRLRDEVERALAAVPVPARRHTDAPAGTDPNFYRPEGR